MICIRKRKILANPLTADLSLAELARKMNHSKNYEYNKESAIQFEDEVSLEKAVALENKNTTSRNKILFFI